MSDAEIEAFIRSFEDCTLPRAEWTHRRHLIMALWYMRQSPREEATRRIRDGIGRLNQSYGNLTGYHETITLAWVEVIDRFLAGRGRDRPISALAAELLESCGEKDHLLRFYSRDLLMSPEARKRWVAPDREDFAPL